MEILEKQRNSLIELKPIRKQYETLKEKDMPKLTDRMQAITDEIKTLTSTVNEVNSCSQSNNLVCALVQPFRSIF